MVYSQLSFLVSFFEFLESIRYPQTLNSLFMVPFHVCFKRFDSALHFLPNNITISPSILSGLRLISKHLLNASVE